VRCIGGISQRRVRVVQQRMEGANKTKSNRARVRTKDRCILLIASQERHSVRDNAAAAAPVLPAAA
jgi:hypothetical protein